MKKLYKLLVLCLFAIAGGSALKAQDVVAKVGDTEYSDFSAAISNWNDGTTLTLLADVERTSSITISNKSVVFDLNGHTYTSSWNIFTVNSGAALTITDTSEDGDGLITYTGSGNYAVFIDGVVTVVGGKITSSAEHNSTIYNSGGTLNITGGILEHTKEDAVDCVSSSTCYISGGNIGGIELDNSNLTVSGNPTLGRVAMYDSFVDISGVTTEGYVITAWYCSVTVGVDLILPEGLELQVETLPVDKLIIGQSGVVSHHHEGGTATCDGQAICDICGKPYGLKLPHDFDEHGECNNCHNHATMSVTDGMNTYYADDATSLNTAVTHILENGSRTFTVNLPSEAEAKIFTAIRRAIIDTEGVEDGSINLTLSGVKAIPNHDEFDPSNLIFGDYYGDELESVYQLASVNLPDVISIGEGAFCGCENLVSITAPKAQTMGKHALYYTALTTVEFPELTTIPSFMMDGTWTLVSAKFPKVTTIESGGLLIGALFKPEAFLLELTAKEDITFVGNNHFNVASQNYSDKVDLVLHINKLDEVDNLTWKGYTFKSINFISTYEVTASVNEENFGTVAGAGTYNDGEEATLVATPNEGYKFVNWTENDTVVSGEAEFTFVVKGDRNLVANFVTLHEITASVNDENFGAVAGAGVYGYGEEVTLTATPNEGYKFVNWTENDTVVSGEAEYTFVVKGNRNLVANFELLTYEVTASVNEENFGAVAGAGVYGYGEEVTLTATPNEGYKFVNWIENDTVVSGEAEYTFVVKGNRNLVANFVSTESIDELTASFRLYPNPANDKLNIVTETEIEEVVVYDAFGRQQLAVSCQQSAISVSGLNAGVYFVMIKTSEGVVTKRFVKK